MILLTITFPYFKSNKLNAFKGDFTLCSPSFDEVNVRAALNEGPDSKKIHSESGIQGSIERTDRSQVIHCTAVRVSLI